MLGVLIAALLIGLAWGAWSKRIGRGIAIGLLVGGGNYALWTVYNAVTAKLGLDTVANLLVNLGLFVALGAIIGVGAGVYAARQGRSGNTQGGEDGNMAGNRD